jgi:protein-S-isoprenylcysteine O-methyltransferase Ste14
MLSRAALALALYLAWLVLAFGARTLVQLRRTGDSGLRVHAGPVGSPAWWAKAGFLAALLAGAAAPLATLIGPLDFVAVLDGGWVGWLGTAVALAGIAMTFVAQLAMGDSWRVGVDPGERTELVTAGVFSVVRNPVFSAMAVTAAGLALLAPNPLALGALAATIISLEVQVRVVEEPHLRRVHGRAYQRYESEVGRFLPGVGRAPQPARADPS